MNKRIICSTPLSSTLYWRMAPLTINPEYLHTSPSCKKYCRFLIFLGTKTSSTISVSPLVNGVVAYRLMYLISASCIDTKVKFLAESYVLCSWEHYYYGAHVLSARRTAKAIGSLNWAAAILFSPLLAGLP